VVDIVKNHKIIIPLTSDLKERIARFARKEETSISSVVRRAIIEFLDREERKKKYLIDLWPNIPERE